MVKDPDEELTQDTPVTSSKFLEEPKKEIKWEEFKPYTHFFYKQLNFSGQALSCLS